MIVKETIKRATRGSVLYAPLRDLYQRAFNPSFWERRNRMASFFSRFISRNDLVFDVGANVGEYTATFLGLGARVVSIEPNPALASTLRALRPRGRVVVESAAAGSQPGFSEL